MKSSPSFLCRRRLAALAGSRPVRQARRRDQVSQVGTVGDGDPLRPRRGDGQRPHPVRRQGGRRQRRDRDLHVEAAVRRLRRRHRQGRDERPSRRSGPRWTSSTPRRRRCRTRWPSSTSSPRRGNIDAHQGRRRRDRQGLQGLPRQLPQGVTRADGRAARFGWLAPPPNGAGHPTIARLTVSILSQPVAASIATAATRGSPDPAIPLARALGVPAATGLAADRGRRPAGGTFNTPGYRPRANANAGHDRRSQGRTARLRDAPSCTANGQGRQQHGSAAASQSTRGSSTHSRRRSELRPPPKPSEFQRFVEAATGRLLPVFGSAFFADAADSFNPVDNVPVSADYTVGPGDEIVLRAWGSIDVDYRTTVDRNGMLNLPKIGSFNVAGVKASELESHLRAQIGRLYTNFNLSVALGQFARSRCSSSARRSAPACTRCRASRRCCRRWSRPGARRRTARCARSRCAATAA